MTHKDYVLLAEALSLSKPPTTNDGTLGNYQVALQQWTTTTLSLATSLGEENPRFDRQQFLRSAGMAQD